MAGGPQNTVRKVSETRAAEQAEAGQRTIRKPQRVVQTSAAGDGGGLKRSTSGLPPSSRTSAPSGSNTLSSSTSLRAFPSVSSKRTIPTISSSSAVPPPSSRTRGDPESPQTPRTRVKSRSMASQALTRSLSRSMSRRGSAGKARDGGTESPETVRPARRTLVAPSVAPKEGEKPSSPRKKAALPGLGRPAPPPSDSPATARKASSTLRSTSSSAQTPLRTSTSSRRISSSSSRPPPTSSASSAMPPPPVPSSSLRAGSSSTLHRRTAPSSSTSSALPLPSAIPVAGRTLRRPGAPPSHSSAASNASVESDASSQRSAIAGVETLGRSRTETRLAGPPRLGAAARPRPSAVQEEAGKTKGKQRESDVSLGSRRDSWVTDLDQPGSARPSFSAAFDPLPSFSLDSGVGDGDRSWETVEGSRRGSSSTAAAFPSLSASQADLSTPRRLSSSSLGPLPSRSSLSYASPPSSSTLLSPPSYTQPGLSLPLTPLSASLSSHSSFASPGLETPRPRARQVSLLRSTGKGGGGGRRKGRDSATLEEILRLGMASHSTSFAGGAGGIGGGEIELLLDEGTSAMMREDLEGVAGETGGGGGGGATPWRGRVLSMSLRSSPGSKVAGGRTPGGGARKSILLSPAATPAKAFHAVPPHPSSDHLSATSALDGSPSDVDPASSPASEDNASAVDEEEDEEETQVFVLPLRPLSSSAETASLISELSHLRTLLSATEEKLEEAERGREEMEREMAELARVASQAQAQAGTVEEGKEEREKEKEREELESKREKAKDSGRRRERAWEDVEERARRMREDARGEVESLRALARGLELIVGGGC
ncbi:hypothetical protein JCM8547_003391 [Rhodosporidiobolus lusitaniae]